MHNQLHCTAGCCPHCCTLSPGFLSQLRPAEHFLAMHITDLNRECLVHLFSFLDKESRKQFSETCRDLHQIFLDPALWTLLNFHSPSELKRDNFVLGSALRYLSVCWHSSRVKVCNIEDWVKTTFQKDICSKHESTVSDFLGKVRNKQVHFLNVIFACQQLSKLVLY